MKNNNKNPQRRLPNLTLPVPTRTPTLPHPLPLPLPLPPTTTTPPLNFSDLQKLSNIGSGSGGTVYKVQHLPTKKLFALKIIHPHHDPTTLKQILKEIQILKNVNHPHIVTCHHIFTHNDQIQVLLEYMHHGSLLNQHIPNEKKLSHLTKQILSALFYLHKRKIVHRDIKPSNLLINSKGDVKIADFGVSTILAKTMDACNSSVGTIAYMSPERINTDLTGGKYDGCAGDVWSLGVSVLECYLGRFPFGVARGGDWASLMCAICMSDPPEAPVTASRELRDFVGCCLRKEPGRRWTAARLLGHPFIVGAENGRSHAQLTTRQMLPPPY